MRHTLLLLLASAGLACAELSPQEFNKLRNFALSCGDGNGFYFAGIYKNNLDTWVSGFRNGKLVADVPTWANNFEE